MTSKPPPRNPKPSPESGWSFEALLDAFGTCFPRLLLRFGVRAIDIEDATQDIRLALWLKQQAIPTDAKNARSEVFRLASLVARDWFREAQGRIVYKQHVDAPSPLDSEEWIAMRMLWCEALRNLDERSRNLIIAHEVDEKTFEEIGAESGEHQDTIRKRFDVAYGKFENEVNRLLGKQRRPKRSSAAFILALSPFDRAVIGALREAEERVPPPSPTSAVHSTDAASKGATSGGWPIGLLAGALVMMPGELSSAPQVLQAAKISDVPLLDVVVTAPIPEPTPVPEAPVLAPENQSKSLQEKQARRSAPSRKLDKDTQASLRSVVSNSGSRP